jgi:hypothetical protein
MDRMELAESLSTLGFVESRLAHAREACQAYREALANYPPGEPPPWSHRGEVESAVARCARR